MNIKDRMILNDFKEERDNFLELEKIVSDILLDIVKETNTLVFNIEHRVKALESLELKIIKKGDHYRRMEDLTDLLGARVICYFSDDVDAIGKKIEEKFVIDWENSVDKRALMKADSFGYLSLHYICSLKPEEGYEERLTNKRFEIQIRTMLQHAWASINHDLGYKNEFGVPRDYVRSFARIAGLLELADKEFASARDNIQAYTEDIRYKIINDNADDVLVDVISLREYMLNNKKMSKFLKDLSLIEGSEILPSEPDMYIDQLNFLKVDTIGKLQSILDNKYDLMLVLANKAIKGSELDILSSNVALRIICQVELITNDYTDDMLHEFMMLSSKNSERAKRSVIRIKKMKEELIK